MTKGHGCIRTYEATMRAPRERTLGCSVIAGTSPSGTPRRSRTCMKRAGIRARPPAGDDDTAGGGPDRAENGGNPSRPGVSYLREMDRLPSTGHRPDLRRHPCVPSLRGVEYAAEVVVRRKGESS